MQGPSEEESIKTMCIVPGQGGPAVASARNKAQGGGKNFKAVLWGQSAGKVRFAQVQENYLQPEKALKACSRNLITLFMTTPTAKDKVPLLCQMAEASVKVNTLSRDPGDGGGAGDRHKSPPPQQQTQHTTLSSVSHLCQQ